MTKFERRKLLLQDMDQLESRGISCVGCKGTCCTYEANSMMVTPLEAFEILDFLKSNGKLTPELKAKTLEAVQKYRLDHAPGNGRRSFLRKTYTCPFFSHQELGCPLPREIKPYGCLAFNSHHETEKAGAHCYSHTSLLKERENQFEWEQKKNVSLREKFGVHWEKSPLPTALLSIWDKEFSAADLE